MGTVAHPRARPGPSGWVYVALTTVVLGVAIVVPLALRPPDLTPAIWVGFIISQTPLATAAAFHLRHPGAWRSAPLLAVGFVAYAAVALMGALGAVILAMADLRHDVGGLATADNLDFYALAPMVIGSFLLWIGLKRARRRPGPTGRRLVVRAVAAITAIEVAAVFALAAFSAAGGGTSGVTLALVLVLIFGSFAAAEGLLATTLVEGAQSGEQPNPAWWIAGFGWTIQLVGLPISFAMAGPFGLVVTANSICMVVAFALGLPAIETSAGVGDGAEGARLVG